MIWLLVAAQLAIQTVTGTLDGSATLRNRPATIGATAAQPTDAHR